MLDRLDLQIEVPALTSAELQETAPAEPSAAVRTRVIAARARQHARGGLNARIPNAALREHCTLDAAGKRLVADAVDRGGMSAWRARSRIYAAKGASPRCGWPRRCSIGRTRRGVLRRDEPHA